MTNWWSGEDVPGHLWAWKYVNKDDPAFGLHRIRGDVQREEGYVLAQLTGAVRFQHVDFSMCRASRSSTM